MLKTKKNNMGVVRLKNLKKKIKRTNEVLGPLVSLPEALYIRIMTCLLTFHRKYVPK